MEHGAEIDARAAAVALHQLVQQGEITLALAVAEAPIDAPEHAAERHDRTPGRLKASGRLVILVNQDEFPADQVAVAEARVRALAMERRLYRVDVEIRFETEYARHQHDRLQFKHEHGGKSRYLEHPIQVARPALRAALERVMT